MRDLRLLAKAHLHLHLTGSMRPDTARDLTVPSARAELSAAESAYRGQVKPSWSNFQTFYDAARASITTPAGLRRVIFEAAQADAEDGSVRTELQVNPLSYAHHFGGLANTVQSMLDACRRAEDASGIEVSLIIAASWTRPSPEAERIARIAVQYAGRGVSGFGISNDDSKASPADFQHAFELARDAGLILTPHTGYYSDANHVLDCVKLLGATRIGHGLAAANDSSVLHLLADHGVTVELCPAAYAPLGLVHSLHEVPLSKFFEVGVPLALSADDPLFFRAGLLDQYQIARETFAFTDERLAELARQSILASGASSYDKSCHMRDIDAWLQS